MRLRFTFLLFTFFQTAVCCTTLIAQQRYIDWEAGAISPVDTVVSGNGLPLEFKWTNHGPDVWEHGDSLFYLLITNRDGENTLTYAGILYNYYDGYDVGQTAVYGDNYDITFNYPDITEPTPINFCVYVLTSVQLTNGDSLKLSYVDPDLSNNISCQPVVVLPQGTSVADAPAREQSFFQVFPNPCRDVVHISIHSNADKGLVKITDMLGREQVRKVVHPSGQLAGVPLALDVSLIPEGMYFLTVEIEDKKASEKIWVAR